MLQSQWPSIGRTFRIRLPVVCPGKQEELARPHPYGPRASRPRSNLRWLDIPLRRDAGTRASARLARRPGLRNQQAVGDSKNISRETGGKPLAEERSCGHRRLGWRIPVLAVWPRLRSEPRQRWHDLGCYRLHSFEPGTSIAMCPCGRLAVVQCRPVRRKYRTISHRSRITAARPSKIKPKDSTTLLKTPKSWHPNSCSQPDLNTSFAATKSAHPATFGGIRAAHHLVEFTELDQHVNDAEFAEAVARKLLHFFRR